MELTKIKSAYTKEDLTEEARRDAWGRYCMRPLSYHPAWLCIKLGITANQVTWASLGIGLSGCALLCFGDNQLTVIGAGLIIARSLADRVDGCVAKATNTVSEYGKRIDIFGDIVIETLLPIAVGIGLYQQQDFLPIIYPLLGLVDSGAKLARYLSFTKTGLISLEPEPGILQHPYRLGYSAIVFKEPVLLVCALSSILYIFTIFYALLGVGRVTMLIKKNKSRN